MSLTQLGSSVGKGGFRFAFREGILHYKTRLYKSRFIVITMATKEIGSRIGKILEKILTLKGSHFIRRWMDDANQRKQAAYLE